MPLAGSLIASTLRRLGGGLACHAVQGAALGAVSRRARVVIALTAAAVPNPRRAGGELGFEVADARFEGPRSASVSFDQLPTVLHPRRLLHQLALQSVEGGPARATVLRRMATMVDVGEHSPQRRKAFRSRCHLRSPWLLRL